MLMFEKATQNCTAADTAQRAVENRRSGPAMQQKYRFCRGKRLCAIPRKTDR